MYCDGAAETAEQGKAPVPKPTTWSEPDPGSSQDPQVVF